MKQSYKDRVLNKCITYKPPEGRVIYSQDGWTLIEEESSGLQGLDANVALQHKCGDIVWLYCPKCKEKCPFDRYKVTEFMMTLLYKL